MRIHVSEAAPAVLSYFTARSFGVPEAKSYDLDYAADSQRLALVAEALATRNLRVDEGGEWALWAASIDRPPLRLTGGTAAVAILRCHVAVNFGDYLEVPERLISVQLDFRQLWATGARCAE